MRLWRKDPATPEGKYPIVLRRDGSALQSRFLVITLRDPAAPAAFAAYAREAQRLGMDQEFVTDMFRLSEEAAAEARKVGPGDPDQPRHRTDDPVVLAWARSIGCPGS
jgi:hypothetical protein